MHLCFPVNLHEVKFQKKKGKERMEAIILNCIFYHFDRPLELKISCWSWKTNSKCSLICFLRSSNPNEKGLNYRDHLNSEVLQTTDISYLLSKRVCKPEANFYTINIVRCKEVTSRKGPLLANVFGLLTIIKTNMAISHFDFNF